MEKVPFLMLKYSGNSGSKWGRALRQLKPASARAPALKQEKPHHEKPEHTPQPQSGPGSQQLEIVFALQCRPAAAKNQLIKNRGRWVLPHNYDLHTNVKPTQWLNMRSPQATLRPCNRVAASHFLLAGHPGRVSQKGTLGEGSPDMVPSLSVLWGGFQNGVQRLCPLDC